MSPLIECIPNISEGRDRTKLDAAAEVICAVQGVHLLHVDPNEEANRTVFTFAGEPEPVCEAAYRLIEFTATHINMRLHQGTHPRMGATDVCPLVPVKDISVQDLVQISHTLAKRVGDELHVPVYLYERSATAPHRENLAHIRRGGYEGLSEKMFQPEWIPDYGPQNFQPAVGATVLGVRSFLVAFNLTLASGRRENAEEIARALRKLRHQVDPEFSYAATLPGVKAIGWMLGNVAQVSTNITSISQARPLDVFAAVERYAAKLGDAVSHSELIGLFPMRALGNTPDDVQRVWKELKLDILHGNDPTRRMLESRLAEELKTPLLYSFQLD